MPYNLVFCIYFLQFFILANNVFELYLRNICPLTKYLLLAVQIQYINICLPPLFKGQKLSKCVIAQNFCEFLLFIGIKN